jgi:hypothetical protein
MPSGTGTINVSRSKLRELAELRKTRVENLSRLAKLDAEIAARRKERALIAEEEEKNSAAYESLANSMDPDVQAALAIDESDNTTKKKGKGPGRGGISKAEKLDWVETHVSQYEDPGCPVGELNRAFKDRFNIQSGPLMGLVRAEKKRFKITGKGRDQHIAVKS